MLCITIHRWFAISIALSAVCLATSSLAAAPPELPDWQYGASVYLPELQTTAMQSAPEKTATSEAIDVPREAPSAATAATRPADPAVVHATHREALPQPADRDKRHLAPIEELDSLPDSQSGARHSAGPLSQFALPVATIYSTVAALALVVGLFLLCMWLLRRSTRRSTAPLPAEVVSVVGRVPLGARQFAELLRVGNKLVLVSLTPTGALPLTEVSDPTEVSRLLGLCQQYDPHSTTKAFEDVFRQLSREPAPAELFAQDALYNTAAPPEPAYRSHRREVRNA